MERGLKRLHLVQVSTTTLHNYKTSTTTTLDQQHKFLEISLTKTNIYGKNSIKNDCIRDWSNLKRTSQIFSILNFLSQR